MNKKLTGIICAIVAVIVLIVAIVLVTKKPAQDPVPVPAPEAESEVATAAESARETEKAKELSYTGVLTGADIYTLTVDGNDGEVVFDITNAQFTYKEQRVITIGDTVTVDYKVDAAKKNVADSVTVDTEVPIVCVQRGIVTDLHEDKVVVVSEQDTTQFLKDSHTSVEGNLSVGDEVEVTYNYNHEEVYHAEKIKVVSENKDPRQVVCIGIIKEVKNNAILVDVDVNVAYTFKLTTNTKVTGKAPMLEKGQTVAVTYMGHPEDSPEALAVEVVVPAPVPKPEPETKHHDETEDVPETKINIETETETEEQPETKIETETEEQPETKIETEPEPEPETEPEPTPDPGPIVHGTGIISQWGDQIIILTEKNKKLELKMSQDTQLPGGYTPAKGDMVHIEFGLKNMTLTELHLISRGDTMTQANIVSWKDGKCVVTNIKAFKEGEVAKDGVDLTQKDLVENEIEFVISGGIDILDGYAPKEGDCIKFRYVARQDGTYEMVFVRYLGAPEEKPAPAPVPETEPAPAPAPETEPAPAPAPETEPAPAPTPETEPAPAPETTAE